MEAEGSPYRRLRIVLMMIILSTLPCYCLGFFMAAQAPRQRATATPALTPTGRKTFTVTPTLFQFPTATFTPFLNIITNTITPTASPTATATSTHTFTPSPSITSTPTLEPTFTETPSPPPPPTETPTPTLTDTPVPTIVPLASPTPTSTSTSWRPFQSDRSGVS